MKRLRTVLVLLFAVAMSLCLFACGGNKNNENETTYYKVTAEYDDSRGSVTLSDPANEAGYVLDENVTVTVTAKTGYKVETFKVNDADQALGAGGSYTFQVKGDTAIKATFAVDEDAYDYILYDLILYNRNYSLTDSDDAADLSALLADIEIIGMTNDEDVYLSGADCDIEGTIEYHTVGSYSLDLIPKENNPDHVHIVITVNIQHDWQGSGSTLTCDYCNASLNSLTENTVIHYGNFHAGTDAAPPTNSGWPETKVYTNYNAEAGNATNIKEFGEVNGKKVPTVTVGQLEKGMTITVRGTARTTAGTSNEWGVANEYWNSPNIGIADSYNNDPRGMNSGYQYGSSVIVRQEGWVLYNGIGSNANTNVLGGIMGGPDATITGWRNYGSHNDERTTASPYPMGGDYDNSVLPTDWSTVGNWYVYSRGDQQNSGDYYTSETAVEYSWTYRDDNVIELVTRYDYNSSYARELKAYIKVPDATRGFYDTILHGDFCDIKITASEIITLRTPTDNGFTYKGMKAGANTLYAENDTFDATTLEATMEYEQEPGVHTPLQLSNSQVFAYTGTLSLAELRAMEGETTENELNTNDNWVALSNTKLSTKYTIYKIDFYRGGKHFVTILNGTDGTLPFTVTANRIEAARGGDVTIDEVTFLNNEKIGNLERSLVSGKIILTLNEVGYAQPLTDAQKALFTGDNALGGASRYVALHFYAADLDTNTVLSDDFTVTAGGKAVPHLTVMVGDDVYVVLALSEASAEITFTGLQTSEVVLNLESVVGFNATSEVGEHHWALNKGGRVELTYHVPASTNANDIRVDFMDGTTVTVGDWLARDWEASGPRTMGELTFYYIGYENGVVTIDVELSGANLNNFVRPYATLRLNGVAELTDYIDYEMHFSDEGDGVLLGDGYLAFVDTNALYVAEAFNKSDVKDGALSGSVTLNINNGDRELFEANGLLTIEYEVVGGAVVITNDVRGVTGVCNVIGTYNDDRDTDVGAFVVLTIDVAMLGIDPAEAYYLDYITDVFNADAAPESFIKVSGGKMTVVSLEEAGYDAERILTVEGTCLVEGLYAWAILDGDTIVCFAGAAVAGGDHKWDGNNCVLCGATRNTSIALTNGETSANTATLKEGEYAVINGAYNDARHTGVFNGIETNIRNSGGSTFYVRVRSDRYSVREQGNDSLAILIPNSDLNETSNDTAVWPADRTGNFLSDADYNDAKKGASFQVFASYANGIVTVEVSHWKSSGELFDVHVTQISLPQKPAQVLVRWRIDNYQNTNGLETDGNCTIVHGTLSPSMIDEIALGAEHEDGESFSSTGINFTQGTWYPESVLGEREAGLPKLSAAGVAAELTDAQKQALGVTGYDRYVAFTFKFTGDLPASTTAKLTQIDGTDYKDAYVKIVSAKEIRVIIPVEAVTLFKLDLTNTEGMSKQSDIVIDLSAVALANIEMTTSNAQLNLFGGTIDLVVEGTNKIADDAQLVLGENALAWGDIALGATLGDDITVSAYTAGDASNDYTATITLTVAAVDLTEQVSAYKIELRTAAGGYINEVSFDCLDMPAATECTIINSDVYVKAEGSKLYLVSMSIGNNATKQISLNVNGGAATVGDNYDLINMFNVSVQISSAGVASFVNSANKLTSGSTIVYSTVGAKNLLVIELDLTGVNITAETAYGFQIQVEDSDTLDTVYLVSAAREITMGELDHTAELEELMESSCTTTGLGVRSLNDGQFFYDVTVTQSHTWETDPVTGLEKCSVCGVLRINGNATNAQTAALAGIVENGLTVSMMMSGIDSDWDDHVMSTVLGEFHVTSPNLQTNIKNASTIPYDLAAYANYNDNVFPGAGMYGPGATPPGGDNPYNFLYDSVNGAPYVTVTMSIEGGVKFYKNGVLGLTYEPTLQSGQITVAKFVEIFLTLAERGGIKLATGAFGQVCAGTNALIDLKVLTAEEIAARYALYQTEADSIVSDNYSWKACTEHTYDKDARFCTRCGALNPEHTHEYVNSFCKWCGAEEEHQHTYEEDGVHCDACGQVDPSHTTHVYKNGVCACGYICRHNFGTTEGDCSICGQFTGTKDAAWSKDLGSTVNGFWGDNSKEAQLGKPAEGTITEAVFTATFDGNSDTSDWSGVLTRIYDGGSEPTAFLQGNNNVLNGSWVDGDQVVRGDLAAYTVDKTGFTCRVTIRWEGSTVTATYEVWEKDADTSLVANKISVMTFNNVEANRLYIWFGLDAVTSSNASVYAQSYTAKA